jgi:hypothetical protein
MAPIQEMGKSVAPLCAATLAGKMNREGAKTGSGTGSRSANPPHEARSLQQNLASVELARWSEGSQWSRGTVGLSSRNGKTGKPV